MELGVSGQLDHLTFQKAVAGLEAAAFRAGDPLGVNGLIKEQTEASMARGYRLIGGFDILWLKGAVQQSMRWMNDTSK